MVHKAIFCFQESVDLIDKIGDFFINLFIDPESEDVQERFDEMKAEVQGSQLLPPELRHVLKFKIRRMMDFTKSKTENPAFAYYPTFRLF